MSDAWDIQGCPHFMDARQAETGRGQAFSDVCERGVFR